MECFYCKQSLSQGKVEDGKAICQNCINSLKECPSCYKQTYGPSNCYNCGFKKMWIPCSSCNELMDNGKLINGVINCPTCVHSQRMAKIKPTGKECPKCHLLFLKEEQSGFGGCTGKGTCTTFYSCYNCSYRDSKTVDYD